MEETPEETEIIRRAMAILGRRAGRQKSSKKTLACRRNGRLGGRPHKDGTPAAAWSGKPRPEKR